MKRLLFVFAAGLCLAAFYPAPALAAHWWWPHRSHSSSHSTSAEPAAAPKPKSKPKKAKTHHEKHHRNGVEPLYSVPKSVGWWHKGPGPAGAGS